MISVSEVHELLTKIYDILDNVMPKQVGNMAHIWHIFNSASRQHHEVLASQVTVLQSQGHGSF